MLGLFPLASCSTVGPLCFGEGSPAQTIPKPSSFNQPFYFVHSSVGHICRKGSVGSSSLAHTSQPLGLEMLSKVTSFKYLVPLCFLASLHSLLFPLLIFLLIFLLLLLLLSLLSLSLSISLSPPSLCDISSLKASARGLASLQHGGLKVGTLHTWGLDSKRQEVKAARPRKACAS